MAEIGGSLLLTLTQMRDAFLAEADKWNRFRNTVAGWMGAKHPVAGQPTKRVPNDPTTVAPFAQLLWPENPGRVDAIFYNDAVSGGGVKAYLIFAATIAGGITQGFSWVVQANSGIALSQINPGYRGAIYVVFSAVDVNTILGSQEFIGS